MKWLDTKVNKRGQSSWNREGRHERREIIKMGTDKLGTRVEIIEMIKPILNRNLKVSS
jgi:hypothetical protein